MDLTLAVIHAHRIPWLIAAVVGAGLNTFKIRLWERTYQYPARLARSAVFNLSDEPTTRSTWSAASGRIPCPRTNSKLWSPYRGRYLLPAELLLAFGVPATQQTADYARVRQFLPPVGMDFAKVVGCLVEVQSEMFVSFAAHFQILWLLTW